MKALLVLLATGTVMLAQTPPPAKSAAKSPATRTAAPAVNPLLHPETLKAKAPEDFKVKFTTTKGDFVVEVHRDWSPLGADRFYNLIRSHFFDNAAFFRIVPGFIVQFGMSADPKVSAAWEKATIKDDPMKPGISNRKGTLVYAKPSAPADQRTTQLFINTGDNGRSLDSQDFSPFGEVTEGMDVVLGLYAGYGERPDQGRIAQEGKAYLDKSFPNLDKVKTASIVPAVAARPAAKSTAPAAKPTAPPAVKK